MKTEQVSRRKHPHWAVSFALKSHATERKAICCEKHRLCRCELELSVFHIFFQVSSLAGLQVFDFRRKGNESRPDSQQGRHEAHGPVALGQGRSVSPGNDPRNKTDTLRIWCPQARGLCSSRLQVVRCGCMPVGMALGLPCFTLLCVQASAAVPEFFMDRAPSRPQFQKVAFTPNLLEPHPKPPSARPKPFRTQWGRRNCHLPKPHSQACPGLGQCGAFAAHGHDGSQQDAHGRDTRRMRAGAVGAELLLSGKPGAKSRGAARAGRAIEAEPVAIPPSMRKPVVRSSGDVARGRRSHGVFMQPQSL